MNTDGKPDLHASGNTKLLLKNETQQIIGCAFEVLNEIGAGLHEKIYENALAVALQQADVAFDQQRRFPVKFRGTDVGEFVPDLIAYGTVIVEAKVIDRITDHERGQILNYLRITKLRVGLILNFRHARLEWERVVL